MHKPRKAVVLAAGFGGRLRPMTLACPKPLVPFEGEAMLFRVLRQLKQWGVQDVCINLHHGAARIVEALLAHDSGLRLSFSYEPEILGTGGVLRRISWFLDQDFWLCNADVVTELDPRPFLRHHKQHKPLATLLMIPRKGPQSVSIRGHQVLDFRKAVSGAERMTFSGVHLLSPDILRYLPEVECFCSVIDAYDRAMADGKHIHGISIPDTFWADLGTADQLVEAHRDRGATGPVLWDCPSPPRGAQHLVTSAALGLWPEEKALLPDAESVEHLPARGSDRCFRRVYQGTGSIILIRRGTARPENDRMGPHTHFLTQHGVRVPGVFHDSAHLQLVEDLGTCDLLSLSPVERKRRMPSVLQLVAQLHRHTVYQAAQRIDLEPAFSPKLYRWERDLFLNEFLTRHDPDADVVPLRRCFTRMAKKLEKQPEVLLHRDLQSTNLLFKQDEAALIDFQGMRLGPASYDLGSCLADPYIEWPLREQLRFLQQYNMLADRNVSEEDYRLGCAQRLCQALGAYGRLGALPGTQRFLEHIPSAVRQLHMNCKGTPLLIELAEWAETYRDTHEF